MNDLRKAAEMALEALEEYGWYQDPVLHLLRKALAQPEQEPVAWITRRNGDGGVVLSGYETCEPIDYDATPVYTAPPSKQKPVAWVRDLTSPQPHCVTSLKYRSVADTDAGVKYIPVYTAPLSKPWVSLTSEELASIVVKHAGFPTRQLAAIEAKLKELNHV